MRTLKQYAFLASLLPASLMLGCAVGGVSSTAGAVPGGDDAEALSGASEGSIGSAEAKAFFDANVQTIVETRCFSCHGNESAADGPDFLGTDPAGIYDSLVGNAPLLGDSPANSAFLNKGAHLGPAFTPEESDAVGEFITLVNQEFSEPGAVTPLPNALEKFANCMDLDGFLQTQAQRVADLNTADGDCASCHTPSFQNGNRNNDASFIHAGAGGTCLQENDQQMFRSNKRAGCMTDLGVTLSGTEIVIADVHPWLAKLDQALACNGAGCHPDPQNGEREKAAEYTENLLQYLNSVKLRAEDPNNPCSQL